MKSGPAAYFILIALLLSILVRSLIPVGFMPDMSSNKIALTICSGLEIKTVFVEDKSAPDHPQKEKHETCPFAPPVMAGHDDIIQIADYIKISYAPFLPNPTAHLNRASITVKTVYSQGPPENFVA